MKEQAFRYEVEVGPQHICITKAQFQPTIQPM